MKPNKRYNALMNEGPQTAVELDDSHGFNSEARRDGVRKFHPISAYYGDSQTGSGKTRAVFYIDGKHNPETVIQKWLDANPKMTENISNWALHQRVSRYGDEWTDASYELLGPFDIGGNGGEREMGGNCPLCDAEYDRQLPDHLPECPKA